MHNSFFVISNKLFFVAYFSAYFSIKLLLCLTIAHSFSMWGLTTHSLEASRHMKNFIFILFTHTRHIQAHSIFEVICTATNLLALWAFSHIFVLRENFLYALHLFWEEIKQKIIIFFIPFNWHLLASWDALTTTFSYLLDNIDAHDVWQNWSTL